MYLYFFIDKASDSSAVMIDTDQTEKWFGAVTKYHLYVTCLFDMAVNIKFVSVSKQKYFSLSKSPNKNLSASEFITLKHFHVDTSFE